MSSISPVPPNLSSNEYLLNKTPIIIGQTIKSMNNTPILLVDSYEEVTPAH